MMNGLCEMCFRQAENEYPDMIWTYGNVHASGAKCSCGEDVTWIRNEDLAELAKGKLSPNAPGYINEWA